MHALLEKHEGAPFDRAPPRPAAREWNRISQFTTVNSYPAHSKRFQKRTIAAAILGAGHGGLALAGYLSHQGHHVALWNRSLARIAPVAHNGGIELNLPGGQRTFTAIAMATASMANALADARLVLVTVPASAHADIARASAPYLRDGQTVLLLPGRTGGALEFRRALRDSGCRARILLGEANSFPLAARTVGPAAALVYGVKYEIQAAALPAVRTVELVAAGRQLLPMLEPARSVLHTGLANVGAILHPVITLMNAERIKRGDSFDFYTEGVTPLVAATLVAADAERRRVARAYGLDVCSLRDWIAAVYRHRGADIRAAVGDNPAYRGIKAPTTLEHRYLLEDVPTGLIPLLELGRNAGLRLPTLQGLLDRARTVLGGDRWQHPRTLKALGLAGLGTSAIRTLVERGTPSVGQGALLGERVPCGRFSPGLAVLSPA
jgi:opine dehydrogenase